MTDAKELDPLAWLEHARFVEGTVLYSKVWGSRSHNTELPESDTDFLAVYAAPNAKMLGLDPPLDSFDQEYLKKFYASLGIPKPAESIPDFQVHEVGKFAQLLMKGNPGILEMLFTNRMVKYDRMFDPLVENRRMFLCKKAVEQYLGYANEQLKKLARGSGLHSKGGVYGEKWGYHMYRVVGDALRIAHGQDPVVWKEGEERATLMQIRRGEWTKERVEKETLDVIGKIEGLKPWSLPDLPDKKFLEDWLIGVRKQIGW